MVNYKQGKIYKIECNVTGLIYIGSTCKKKLSGRMTQHRSDYKMYLKGKKKYLSSFKVMENNDYDIILIEDYPCKSKDQLFARERYYTNEIECVNIHKNQGRYLELGEKKYLKDYYKENASVIKAKSKDYYKENTSTIKARHKY
jgi:calcineurin-like phosphoesterase family protein